MLLPFAAGLNTPPAPPLVPRADVVFSLQRAGADAVFSFQFPVATGSVVVEQSFIGGGRMRPQFRDQEPIEGVGGPPKKLRLLMALFDVGAFHG